jgi:REP element-mobilizing transposase RayT
MRRPIAYHITWGTYGTRLHGDARGTVDRGHNEFGTPVLGPDPERQLGEFKGLKFRPVVLRVDQRLFIESILPSICVRGHWKYIEGAAGPDHVHAIVSSPFDPETVRRLMKRWLCQALSERWPLPDGATWWAEDGSIRWIDNERYFDNAVRYVHDQRTTPDLEPQPAPEPFHFDLRLDVP